MNTIVLEVEDALLERAQRLAEARNMTVSEMVERLLRVAAAPPLQRSELPPLARQAWGMLPPLTDDEVRETLDEELIRRFGSK